MPEIDLIKRSPRGAYLAAYYAQQKKKNLADMSPAYKEEIIAKLFSKRVITESGCWEWTGHRSGRMKHGATSVFGIPQYVHRVAWSIFKGPIPDNLCVLHHCDNPICFNYEKCLFLGTPADNTQDMMNKNRCSRQVVHQGEAHPLSKLSEIEVIEIRKLHAIGGTYRGIARAFGLDASTVTAIVKRETWRHVTASLPAPCAAPVHCSPSTQADSL